MIINDLQVTQNLIIGSSSGGVQFPTTDGSPGYLLTTDGSGILTWGPGTPGPTGPSGPPGGPQGPTGFQGPSGPAGGPQGVTGSQGVTGPQGFQGSQGRTGDQGPTGFQGVTGSQGVTGPQGLAGTPGGPQGFQGDQGPIGPQGDVGQIGPQGDQGTQGFQGAGGTITILNDTFTSSDTITITHSFGYYPVVQVLNDVYEEIIPVSITHNSVNDFTVILSASASGLIITAAGVEGPQGFQGFQGDFGPQGYQGPYGFQGLDGPQGFQGTTGIQGYTGPAGVTGSDGPNSIRLIFGASASGSPSATGSFNISGGLSFSAANGLYFNSTGILTNDIYGNVLYPWLNNILTDYYAGRTITAQISEIGNASNYGIYTVVTSSPSPNWTWSLTFVSGGGTFSTDRIYTISEISGGIIGVTGPTGPTGPAGVVVSTQSVPTYSGSPGVIGDIIVANGEYLYIHTGDQWLKSSMTFSTF